MQRINVEMFNRRAFSSIWWFWQSHALLLGVGILAIYFAGIALVSWLVPGVNWDMVAYVAASIDRPQMNDVELHHQAWAAVRDRVSQGEFLVLTSDRPYRIAQFENPSAFASMLGFYKVKVLYVAVASWLSQFFQPVDALRLVTAASVVLTGVTVLVWSIERRTAVWAPVIVALFILSGFGTVARQVVPDIMAAMFLVAAAYAFLARRDLVAALALVLAFLTRPDHLVFVSVLAITALLYGESARRLLFAMLICLVSYFAVTASTGHPGWWIQLWLTQVEYVPTLDGFNPDFSLLIYGRILVQALARSLVDENWLAMILLQCIAWGWLVHRALPLDSRQSILVTSIIASTALKFPIAPMHETRFYLAYLLIFGLVLIEVAAQGWRVRRAVSD